MRRLVFVVALVSAFPASKSGAEEPKWLRVDGRASCLPSTAELEERIQSLAFGSPDPRLTIRVTLETQGQQTIAVVELLSSSRVTGSKRLVSASCDEAVQAVVSVAALAMSSSLEDQSGDGGSDRVTSSPSEEAENVATTEASLEPLRWQVATLPAVERDTSWRSESEPRDPNLPSYRVLGTAGVDWGTLGEPLGLMGVGSAWVSGRSALLGMGWYGITSQRVEQGPDTYYRESSYVGSLTLDYCHGVNPGQWFSACAGVELGWLVFSREERETGGVGVEKYHSSPTFAPRLGALMGLRAGPIQPEFGLFAQVPALGRAPRGQRLALRASLGAAVVF